MAGEPLHPLALPTGEGEWPAWLDARAGDQLRLAGDHVAALRTAPLGDEAVLELWNDAQVALGNVSAVASLLSQVHPDPAVVAAAEAFEVEARRFSHDLHLDRAVDERLRSVPRDSLDDDARRVLDDALLHFRRAGVDRDEEARERLRALDARAAELGQEFSRGIRDGRRTVRVPEAALAGLPEDFRDAHPVVDGHAEISTDYPDTHPFLTFSEDAAARAAVARSFFDLGWPHNDAVLADLLAVRRETAELLGYPDWPSYDAELKMIGRGEAIPAFIDEIAEAALPAAQRELEVLLACARAAGEDRVDVAGWRHWFEVVKRERFDVDAQEVSRYLDFTRVRQGLLDVTGRLFGLAWTPVDVPVWHPDVTAYDVALAGERLGRIYLDLHPRPGKFNHAAQFDLVRGIRDRQLPEGVLVCNFPRGLMDHHDVVTLFHEFGHLIHHVLAGRHPWARFSGVATEWDFVEAPSQMLEEWAWHPDVLATFATDADGTPIPADLVARMRRAEEFGKGVLARTQMFYAATSYWFHQEQPADLTARLFELYAAYSLIEPLPDTHFHTGFGHLEGYSSAYYTYMWSQVIAKDLLSAFDPDDPFATEVAHRYRDTVLAPGGSRDAADLVADFLGRPYDNRAFSAWLGEEAGDA